MTAADPFDLERFVTAQAPVFPAVLAELKAGRKRTHWMWFVFPQLRGLGHSSMATFYGIGSLHEARAYLSPGAGAAAGTVRPDRTRRGEWVAARDIRLAG
jgi:uncharacterized protein (DUF1810 family)